MKRVEGGISGHIQSYAGKDEEEGVRNEGGGSFGKADLLVEGLLEESLRCMIGKGEAASDANNMLGTRSPEFFSDFTSEESIEVAIVHLLGGMLS